MIPCDACGRPVAELDAHDDGLDDLGRQRWVCVDCCRDCTQVHPRADLTVFDLRRVDL